MEVVRAGLWKGCLGGIGLAILFVIISGVAYLLLKLTNLSENIILLLSIASGPIIGTFGVLGPLYFRARSQLAASTKIDETTPGDTP